jgi:hypothetical protein
LSSADIPARFAELVEAMGDEERARVAVEQNPNTLRFANIKIMFAQLADICGINEYACALVEKSSTCAQKPPPQGGLWRMGGEVYRNRQALSPFWRRIASLHSKLLTFTQADGVFGRWRALIQIGNAGSFNLS